MEHLILPKYCSMTELPLIPCLVDPPLAANGFLTIPSKTHFCGAELLTNVEQLHWIDFDFKPSNSDRAFLQEWLFFGLIREFLERYITSRELVRETGPASSPRTVLTTESLIEAVQKWHDDIREHKANPLRDIEHLRKCLQIAFLNLKSASSILDSDTAVSYAAVGELLDSSACSAFEQGHQTWYPWRGCVEEGGHWWAQVKTHKGFCQFQTQNLISQELDVYSSFFNLPLARSALEESHVGCSTEACVAHQNDLGTYETKHVDQDCRCEHLSVAYSDLFAVLAAGSLPLLRIISGSTLSELSVHVISSKLSPRYVAIPHVWAEGLGNAEGNALPRCQLQSLGKLAEEMKPRLEVPQDEELLVWCDTMCCPAKEGEGKNLGLLKMKETYLQSAATVVLSKTLQDFDLGISDGLEVAMRLAQTPWTRRLWTLQEGVLSMRHSRLWLRLKHEMISFKALWNETIEVGYSKCSQVPFRGDLDRSYQQSFISDRTSDDTVIFAPERVAHALIQRSVSHAPDEALLVANFLNLEIDTLLTYTSAADRMQHLWTMMSDLSGGIPAAFLFTSGDRLDKEGLRWAPSTLLVPDLENIGPLLHSGSGLHGKLTDRGLLVPLSGYDVKFPARPLFIDVLRKHRIAAGMTYQLNLHGINGVWYAIELVQHGESLAILMQLDDAEVPKLRILHLPEEVLRPPLKHEDDPTKTTNALLVIEMDRTSEIIFVQSTSLRCVINGPFAGQNLFYKSLHLLAEHLLASTVLEKIQSIEALGMAEDTAVDELQNSLPKIFENALEMPEALAVRRAHQTFFSAGTDPNTAELLADMVIGIYACQETVYPPTQQWCID